MEKLNNKIQRTKDQKLTSIQPCGVYGYNESDSTYNRAGVSDNGDLHVNIHGTTGGGDMKARTNITDSSTSTFLKCNADGTLEMTAELSTAGLATSAEQVTGNNTLSSIDNKIILPSVLNSDQLKVNDSAVIGSLAVINNNLTDGSAVNKSMGSEDGTKTGTQKQLRVDSAGHLQVDVVTGGGGDATLAEQQTQTTALGTINSTLGDTNSKIDAMRGTSDLGVVNTSLGTINGTIGDTNSKIDAMRASDSLTTLKDSVVQNMTDGSAKTKIMGLFGGGQYQVATDASGHLQVDVLSGGGGGTQFAGEATLATTGTGTAMIGRDNTGVARLVATDTSGNLQVDILSGGGGGTQFAGEATLASTGTGTAMIGRDNTGVARLVATDTSGNLQVDISGNSDTTKATSTLQTAGNASLTTIAGAVSGTEVQVDVRNRTDASPVALTFSAGNKVIAASGVTRTAAIDVGGCSSYVIMMNMLVATTNSSEFANTDISIEYSPDDGTTFMGTSSLSSGLEIIEPKALYQASGAGSSSVVGYGVYIQSTSTMASPLMGVARTNKIKIAVQNTFGSSLTLDSFSIYKFN